MSLSPNLTRYQLVSAIANAALTYRDTGHEDYKEDLIEACQAFLALHGPPPGRLASSFVTASEDRMTASIQAGGETLRLEAMPSLPQAKAQYADALWVVQQILEAGRKSP